MDEISRRTETRAALIPPRPPVRTAVAAATPPLPAFRVVRGTAEIGRSALECPVQPGRRAAGRLQPGPGYAAVRDVFALYRRAGDNPVALRRFTQARDALGLRVLDADGLELRARVELVSEWESGVAVLHLAIADERYWARPEAGEAR